MSINLYKMELYKICYKRFFAAGVVCMIGILLLSFQMQVLAEETNINGITYKGYAAIRMDREITEEFKGVITEEKARRIIEKYGFPYRMEEDGALLNANFLNLFVSEYFRGGSFDIRETDIGRVMEMTGEEVYLAYYHGWYVFFNVLQVGMILGSVLLLCSVSVVFSGERQAGMRPLIFTTREGKRKDICARYAAAFTVTGALWLGIVGFSLTLCGFVYGLDGLKCYNGMVMNYLFAWPQRMIPMDAFAALTLFFSFLGMNLLCAITLCLSAKCRSNFYTLVTAAIFWGTPVLAVGLLAGGRFDGIFRYLAAAPVFMVLYLTMEKIYDIWQVVAGIAVAAAVFCVIDACREYGRQESV
ncbi:MAG: hypothetical protein NC434_04610 [Ruminococcus sp.]|nr:hypothetical protein [Ruminococcus sp.]